MTDFVRTSSAEVALVITPHASTNMPETRGIYVGVGGDVVAIVNGSAVTFKNVQSGSILPIRATRVNATSTTATDMVGLY